MRTVVSIDLGDSARHQALRDYFLRLGAFATIDEHGFVTVSVREDDDLDVAEYLLGWTDVSGAPATIRSALSQPTAGGQLRSSQAGQVASGGDVAAGTTEPKVTDFPPFEVVPRAGAEPRPPRLGDLLVSKGFITEEQLSEGLVESRNTGELLGLVLLRKGFVFGAELARALSEQWGIPYLNLSVISVDRRVVHLLPQEIGTKFAAIPVRYLDGAVQVAFADPSDPEALAAVRAHIPSIAPGVAELADIVSAWRDLRPAG